MHTQIHTHPLTHIHSIDLLAQFLFLFCFSLHFFFISLCDDPSCWRLLRYFYCCWFLLFCFSAFPPLVKLFDFDHFIHLISFIIFLEYLFCFVLSWLVVSMRFSFFYYSWNACLATVIKYIKIVAYIYHEVKLEKATNGYMLWMRMCLWVSIWHVRINLSLSFTVFSSRFFVSFVSVHWFEFTWSYPIDSLYFFR